MRNYSLLLILFLIFLGAGLSVTAQDSVYIPFRKGKLWGFADTSRNIVVEPIYSQVKGYKNNLFIILNEEKYGVVSLKNKVILNAEHTSIIFKDQYIIAHKDRQKILFSIIGKSILPTNIADFWKFQIKDQALVRVKTKSGKYGVIQINENYDQIEKWVLDTAYSRIFKITEQEDLIIAKKGGQYSKLILYEKSINITDEELELLFEADIEFVDQEISDDNPNPTKKKAVKPWTDYTLSTIEFNNDNKIVVEQKTKNKDGKYSITLDTLPTPYWHVDLISNNQYFSVSDSLNYQIKRNRQFNWAFVIDKDQKKGVINALGEIIIPLEYDKIEPNFFPLDCKKPLFTAQKGQKWGLIDQNNNVIIDFNYDKAFVNHYRKSPAARYRSNLCFNYSGGIVVYKDDAYGMINAKEEIWIPFKYDHIKINVHSSAYSVMKDGKHGIIRRAIEHKDRPPFPAFIIEPVFDHKISDVEYFNGYPVGIIKEKTKLLGYADAKGFLYYEN